MNRREFLLKSGRFLAAVSAMPLIAGCSGEVRRQFSLHGEKGFLGDFLSDDEILILYMASLAPSGHNAQPWTVTVHKPHRFIIGSNKDRWLPAVDPDNRELLLSIGAFLENLAAAAGHLGYEVSYTITAKDPEDVQLMEVRLKKAAGRDYPLERIASRRTVRGSYLDTELSPEDIRLLRGNTKYIHYFPSGSSEANLIAGATLEANQKQVYRDDAQEELAGWIRWSNRDARKFRNGLTPAGMEIPGVANFYVRHFYNSRTVMTENFRQRTLEMLKPRITAGAGWVVISSNDSGIPSLIETGRRFEKVFLTLRERMIAWCPMTQALEEEPWKYQISQELGVHMPVQFIMRVGYVSSYPDPVSLRMPVTWFTCGT